MLVLCIYTSRAVLYSIFTLVKLAKKNQLVSIFKEFLSFVVQLFFLLSKLTFYVQKAIELLRNVKYEVQKVYFISLLLFIVLLFYPWPKTLRIKIPKNLKILYIISHQVQYLVTCDVPLPSLRKTESLQIKQAASGVR